MSKITCFVGRESEITENKIFKSQIANVKTKREMLPTANNVRQEQKGNLIFLRNFATTRTLPLTAPPEAKRDRTTAST